MARPKKERVICACPQFRRFSPSDAPDTGTVYLTLDEYEVFRLHDLEHLRQAEIALQMKVSRATVAEMLDEAHRKLADVIVNGRQLRLEGGRYCVCPLGSGCPYASGDCPKKHRCGARCRCGLYMDEIQK